MTTTASSSEVRIAAINAAEYVYAAQAERRIELAQSRTASCESGTFWEQFFCQGSALFDGVSGAIASLMDASIELAPEIVTIDGVSMPCEAFRLTPKSADFSHVETGILPGQSRRVPRGLYCLICRTTDNRLLPLSTLDLVDDENAGPRAIGDESERCAVTG